MVSVFLNAERTTLLDTVLLTEYFLLEGACKKYGHDHPSQQCTPRAAPSIAFTFSYKPSL
jgi:hypothetical protein